METRRLVIPEAEEVIDRYFPVLDHGFVALKDYMGGDLAIEEMARTSYGKSSRKVRDTRKLIRYLFRKRHTSPFERTELVCHLGLPIFVMRQLVRHRTACLAGQTELHFDLPAGIRRCGSKLYKMTVGELYRKFNADSFRSGRVQGMHLRCIDESTQAVRHTHIVDMWESGQKPVYRVTLEDGSSAVMSADHLCFTENGWFRLKDVVKVLPGPGERVDDFAECRFISVGPGRNTAVVPSFNVVDEGLEDWLPIVGWEGWYEVSNQGRVRRVVSGKGARSFGRCKQLTISSNHACVSLNRPGIQEMRYVHFLMLEAFIGPRPKGMLARHLDGNGLNNVISNLAWGTQQENSDDRVRDGATVQLRANESEVASVEYIGEEMTYDLEVEGPWHNFSAGGMIVHNSLNEHSGRYSPLPLLFYTPKQEQVCRQSTVNKQGREVPLDLAEYNRYLAELLDGRVYHLTNYPSWLSEDISREIARIELPVSTYTYCYWKMDLKNLLHLIGLRADPHAQWEIRHYANVLGGLVKRVAPLTFEAFVDYQMEAVTFSQAEMAAIRALAHFHTSPIAWTNPPDDAKQFVNDVLRGWGVEGREADEFWAKLQRPVRPDFDLDPARALPPEHFEQIIRENSPV